MSDIYLRKDLKRPLTFGELDANFIYLRDAVTGGTTGSSGGAGSSGTAGTSGTGAPGTSGSSGTSGQAGSSGSSGTSGTSGISGTTGTSGSSGARGTSGTSGITGTSGTAGRSGTSGTTGTTGTSGTSGVGESGSSGTSGTGSPGSSGTSGVGASGSSGSSGVSPFGGIEPNSGVIGTAGSAGNNLATLYNTLLDPSLTVPTTVGGIVSGTTVSALNGKSLVGIVDDLLFPTVLPTYTIPTISTSSTVTGVKEIGTTWSPVLTTTGTKNDAGKYTQIRILKNINGGGASVILTQTSPTTGSTTDIAAQFGYADPNNPNRTYTGTYTDTGLIIPSGTTSSTVVYSGDGNYDAGVAKNNNKGVLDVRTPALRSTAAPQTSGSTFASGSQTITGYYPYFYGKSATQLTSSQIKTQIQTGTGFTQVIAAGSGTLTMTFSAVGEWCWFAILSGYATKSTWADTTNPLNNGNIGLVPTDLFAAPTTESITSASGYWSNINFKVYPSNKVTTLGSAYIA